MEQLHNLEQRPSHRSGFQQLVELVEIVMALLLFDKHNHFIKFFWPNVLVVGTIEQPLVHQGILVTTTGPIVEVTLICAYCEQVGHEFKNFPFVDDKLKKLMRKKLKTSL